MTREKYDELENVILEKIEWCLKSIGRFSTADVDKDAAYAVRNLAQTLSLLHHRIEEDVE